MRRGEVKLPSQLRAYDARQVMHDTHGNAYGMIHFVRRAIFIFIQKLLPACTPPGSSPR